MWPTVTTLGFITLLVVTHFDCISSSHLESVSPCVHKDDREYEGVLVDCQGQGLTVFPPADWLPENTTTLLLGNNRISHLDDVSLQNLTELRHLSLASNNLKSIESESFQHNSKLQKLELNGNNIRLDGTINTTACFQGLHHLQVLYLTDNGNSELYSPPSSYPPNLLYGLRNLRTLSLDTFRRDLHFNGIFDSTTNLTTLMLSGGLTAIRNESFKDFNDIKLKELTIQNAPYLKTTEQGSFWYLKNLDSYWLQNLPQGLTTTLDSLGPFVHRNFSMLRFIGIKDSLEVTETFTRDGVITPYNSRHLFQICVRHFDFSGNGLFYFEWDTHVGPLWSKCLVSLDLSDNPLLGETYAFMHVLHSLQALQSLKITNRKYCLFNQGGRIQRYNFLTNTRGYAQNDYKSEWGFSNKADYTVATKSNIGKSDEKTSFNVTGEKTHTKSVSRFTVTSQQQHHVHGKVYFIIYLPKSIRYMNLDGYGDNTLRSKERFQIRGAENLEELHVSDGGVKDMIQPIDGFGNLRTVDISKNDGSNLTPAFISSFTNVTTLNMSRMGLSPIFTPPGKSHDLYSTLSNLQTLDLSYNDLYTLPKYLFSLNKNLQVLILSGNRFKMIPFDFQSLPNLHTLDLRSNSFLRLSSATMRVMEKVALENPLFSLKLDRNLFSCSCSNVNFLSWLTTTTVRVDTTEDIVCITENGQITTLHGAADVQALRRRCNGYTSFMTSLILLCLTALSFSVVAFYMKFKTQLLAVVYQLVKKEFSLKRPRDYFTGVYVGYSDNETNLACMTLRSFIENRLHLSTYLRHRDLIPASDMAASIITAINSSWRILLVITDSYLADNWSFLAMKTAVYSVSSSNPGRLVIVILSDTARYRIPDYLLNAVREENIINVTLPQGDQNLARGEMEKLERALLNKN